MTSRQASMPATANKKATVQSNAAAVVSACLYARFAGTRMDSAPSWEEQRSLIGSHCNRTGKLHATPHAAHGQPGGARLADPRAYLYPALA